MVTQTELREQILNDLREIIFDALDDVDAKVYLFGSWARNDEKQSSDIDIAVESVGHLCSSTWLDLVDKVEESIIPYHVDIVNLEYASPELIQNVKKEGVLWKD